MVPIIGTKNDTNTLFINDILNFILGHAPKNAPPYILIVNSFEAVS